MYLKRNGDTNKYDDALSAYKKCQNIKKEILKDHSDDDKKGTLISIAESYEDIANMYMKEMYFQKATEHSKISLKLKINYLCKDKDNHSLLALLYKKLGHGYLCQINMNEEAIESIQKAVGIIDVATFGTDDEYHSHFFDCYEGIGIGYNTLGKYANSLEWYRKALYTTPYKKQHHWRRE